MDEKKDHGPPQQPKERSSSEALVSIQVLRGVAATLVVFFHVSVIGSAANYLGRAVFWDVAKPGSLGVNLFFVLSGYIILRAHYDDIGVPSRIMRYVKRRLSRIYPVYWVFLTAFILAALAGVGALDNELSIPYLLSSYLLVDVSNNPVPPLKVAWTLFYEIKFYAVFALLILHKRLGILAFILWFASILYVSVTGTGDRWDLVSLWSLHFFVGMGVFFLSRIVPRSSAAVFFIASIGAIGWYIWAFNYDVDGLKANMWLMYVLAPAFGGVLLAAVLWEDCFALRAPRIFRVLGDASYSLYLVHSATISLGFIVLGRMHIIHAVPESLLYFLLVAAGVLSGVIAHWVVERPILQLVRTRRLRISMSRAAG